MGVVLDTSVIIAAEHGRFALDRLIMAAPHERYCIAAITASELLLGVHLLRDAASRSRKAAAVEMILSKLSAIPFGIVEARLHADLMATLRRRGALIGAHDLLIAATAVAGGHSVATLDLKHFSRVPGLSLVDTAPYAIA